jgi:multidrug efflux pump subunit AcrA (membrane-fusion protein)
VKKGDVICVLDSTLFQDQLVNQRITVKMAEAAFLNAKLGREVAEIAVREYREGDFVSQLTDAEGDITIAEAELSLADMEFKAAKADASSGTLAIKRAEVAVLRARFALEKAQNRKRLLKDYTSEKRIKELESAVKKVHAEELAGQATWELEVSKESMLERQIVNSTLTAPIDGRLQYHQDPSVRPIAVGVPVQEGQIIFSIEPPDGSATSRDKTPAPDGSPLQ